MIKDEWKNDMCDRKIIDFIIENLSIRATFSVIVIFFDKTSNVRSNVILNLDLHEDNEFDCTLTSNDHTFSIDLTIIVHLL